MKSTILRLIIILAAACSTNNARSQDLGADSTKMEERQIEEAVVVKQRAGTTRINSAMNAFSINKSELFKAACCNLGESFSTNPSVDVNYSDATTGARQIKLLGLAGTYVQMLTETMPNFRNSAAPYSLSYVPGPWMKSIQVSKGAASVKNGYESVTGQINVQYLQPEDEEGATINLYGSTMARFEANGDANLHLNQRLSTEILMHHENEYGEHDSNNDGFVDMPKVKQWNIQNRWAYLGQKYIFHGGVAIINEKRDGGQTEKHVAQQQMPLYKINIDTERYEIYMKHAVVLDQSHATNIALMTSATLQEMDSRYSWKRLKTNDKNAYASLMFETNITPSHNISVGTSINHDYLRNNIERRFPYNNDETTGNTALTDYDDYKTGDEAMLNKETTWGGYTQYTFTKDTKLTVMAGIRADHSSVFGTFLTPRMHIKYAPNNIISLRFSAGKGYRMVHPLAEYGYLLASGRRLVVDQQPMQERAWT